MKKITSLLLAGILSLSVISPGLSYSYADSYDLTRIEGRDRYQTSIESAKYNKSRVAVIANGKNFADALSAVNICNSMDANLYLTKDNGTQSLIDELVSRGYERVFIIGGSNAISYGFEQRLLDRDFKIKRLSGSNRYKTNEATLKEAAYTRVGVADGRNYPDALGSVGLLKNRGLGLKLVNGSKGYTSEQEVVYTFGARNSVIQNNGKRLAGRNRYETNYKINKELGDVKTTSVVDGRDFPDALSSENIINAKGGSVLLVPDVPSVDQMKYIRDIEDIYVVGGEKSVSDITVSGLLIAKNLDVEDLDEDTDEEDDTFFDLKLSDLRDSISDKFDEVREERRNDIKDFVSDGRNDIKEIITGNRKDLHQLIREISADLDKKTEKRRQEIIAGVNKGLKEGYETVKKDIEAKKDKQKQFVLEIIKTIIKAKLQNKAHLISDIHNVNKSLLDEIDARRHKVKDEIRADIGKTIHDANTAIASTIKNIIGGKSSQTASATDKPSNAVSVENAEKTSDTDNAEDETAVKEQPVSEKTHDASAQELNTSENSSDAVSEVSGN